jgi:hypothetical protein
MAEGRARDLMLPAAPAWTLRTLWKAEAL